MGSPSDWRSADELGWKGTGDVEDQIRSLGGDPVIVAHYLVLARCVFGEGCVRNLIPPNFWPRRGGLSSE